MHRRSLFELCAMLGLSLVTATCDSTGPSRLVEIPDCWFPTEPVPTWIAVQVDGRSWQQLPVSGHRVILDTTARVGLAFGFGGFSWFYYVAVSELRGATCQHRDRSTVTKTLSSHVAGVGTGQIWTVEARDSPYRLQSGPLDSSTMLQVADGPTDIVALLTNNRFWIEPDSPSRLIVRRNVSLPNGAIMPNFDFASTEALTFDSASVSVLGLPTGVSFYPDTNEIVVSGVRLVMSSRTLAGPQRLYGAPAALGKGDYHSYSASVHGSTQQHVGFYYFTPRDTMLTMGPAIAQPNVSVPAGGCLSFAASLPAQAEYPDFVTVALEAYQSRPFKMSSIRVTVSREYLGATPATWKVDTPFAKNSNGACLASPYATRTVTVTAGLGRVALTLGGASARDGEVLLTSSRSLTP